MSKNKYLNEEGLKEYDKGVKNALNKKATVFVTDKEPTSEMKKGDLWLKDSNLYFYNGSEWEQIIDNDDLVVVENYL